MSSNPQASGAQPLRPLPVGVAGLPQNFGQPMAMQFRPVVPSQPTQQFIPVAPQQFRPLGQGISAPNVGMHSGQMQQPQFNQPMQQLPPRPSQPAQGPPSSLPMPMPYVQPNRPVTSGPIQQQQNSQPPSNRLPGLGGPGMPLSSSYTFATSYGQPNNINTTSHYHPVSQMHAPVTPVGTQPWLSSGSQTLPLAAPLPQSGQQSSVTTATAPVSNFQPNSTVQSMADWQEHTSADGRRYYYNKKTRQSSWEKPIELMTPIERADASTVWKEYTTPEGRKYFYNKVTKQSKWVIPDELKLAREQAEKAATQLTKTNPVSASAAAVVTAPPTEVQTSEAAPSTTSGVASSPVLVTPVVNVANPSSVISTGTPSVTAVPIPITSPSLSLGTPTAISLSTSTSSAIPVAPLPTAISTVAVVPTVTSGTVSTSNDIEKTSHPDANSADGASSQDLEEAKSGIPITGKINITPLEVKTVDEEEPSVYANKQDAKNAFKALLESANVESDWTWEQAMRAIINDKRYGALKSLGERKQVFHEYLGQRKKQDAEERRIRQKKAREDFTKMLEESEEITSTTRWSKAITMFEHDERFTALERERDREDLFENYLGDLRRKERAKAQEEHKRNIMEYREFLKSCDFIKANSQWRKVQDRLEEDERCSRLEKFDRLEIFQEYVRDLEREEEEHRKIEKEQLRRSERKNRDEFRKLMEGHVAAGILTAKTHWRDYCMQVKDLPAYIAVSANTSGATPKDLFEDVAEELEKQYHEDKSRMKDALKMGKINMTSTWTIENFKDAIAEDGNSSSISEINLKLLFDDLLERLKEKEQKEVKKRQRLANEFSELLRSTKEITASSKWEDCKQLFDDSKEYRAIGEESFKKEVFYEHIAYLQEKAKEKERKRDEEKARKEKEREEKEKRREKERKEKDRERERERGKERSRKEETENENIDVTESHSTKEDKKREKEKEKDRKHRKRHQSAADDSSERDEKEESKKSRRHTSDRRKSRKHNYNTESDSENRHKRHKRDRDGSRRNGAYEDLEDGELGEDGEIC